MNKILEIIPIDDWGVIVAPELPCPAGSWVLFPNTCNGQIKDYTGCMPIKTKWTYATNGVYNLRVVASYGKRLEGLPLITLSEGETIKTLEVIW
jgi:hypothetical protein